MWDGYPEYRHGYMWYRLIWFNISYANMHKVWLGINAWSLLYWWYHWIIIWRRDTKLRHPVFLDRLVSVPLVMSPSLNPTSSSLTAPPSRLSSVDLSVFTLYSTAYCTAVSTGVRADRLFSYFLHRVQLLVVHREGKVPVPTTNASCPICKYKEPRLTYITHYT